MKNLVFLFCAFIFCPTCQLIAQVSVFDYKSIWKYLDNGADQGTNWSALNFNDGTWKTGNGKFGYGISGTATTISYGPSSSNKYITTYFRKTFSISDISFYSSFSGHLYRDDGVVVYVNGAEVYRNNMPAGTISYSTQASVSASDNGSSAKGFTISNSAFVSGTNIVAVEIHQFDATTPDMAFDMRLEATPAPFAVQSISRQTPLAQNTNASSMVWRVKFNRKVRGVDSSDFSLAVVSGALSGAISQAIPTGIDSTSYDVTAGSVSGNGTLRLDLKSTGTGITDSVGNALSGGFSSGETYLIDQAAPLVQSSNRQQPLTEATSASSVTFRVAFSEKVRGVDSSDFILTPVTGSVSGVLAAGSVLPTGTDSTSYDVTVSSLSGNGSLRLDLKSGGNGIADVAGNAINGGFTSGQTYLYSTPSPFFVKSIVRQSPSSQFTTASSVTYRVTFSKKVKGVDAADFQAIPLSGNVRGTLAILALQPSGQSATDAVSVVPGTDSSAYDVKVRALYGSGTLRLDLKSSGTGITDSVGNALSGGFASGETYDIQASQGFISITDINPISASQNTADKPQGKVWTYAGKWWLVLATASGTNIYRLDGASWTKVLALDTSTIAKADCRVAGNLVHILLFNGPNTGSFLYSVEYDALTNAYKLWSNRPSKAVITFETGTETATLDVDGTGRMWIASDGNTTVLVRYSDAPYSTWSSPITLASNISTDDISVISAIPALGKIGVLWSDQTTQRFGFKTHTDGADPNTWSSDEVPASQSAINFGHGMADDHLNIVSGSDGTLYCAVKTSYDQAGYFRLCLMVRHTNGSWDNLYPVTSGFEGTRPVVVLNETTGKIRVFYTSIDADGDILYRESALSVIAFGPPITLMSGTYRLNNSTTTHQINTADVVILASDENLNPKQVVGVLGVNGQIPPVVQSISRQQPLTDTTSASSVTFRVTFSKKVRGVDSLDFIVTTVSGTAGGALKFGAATATGSDSTTYDVRVSNITGTGSLRLDVKAGGTGIADTLGNALNGGFSGGQAYTIITATANPLIVQSISRQNPLAQNTNASSMVWRVKFNRKVRGVDSSDFSLAVVSGALSGAISQAIPTGIDSTSYDVTAGSVSGNGTLRLDLKSTGTGITDSVGNALSGGFSSGETYLIDQTAPLVQSISRQQPLTDTTSASSVTFRVTFSKKVRGVDSLDFIVTTVSGTAGGALKFGAATATGSDSTTYDVRVSNITGTGSLRLDVKAGGTGIADTLGNALNGGFSGGQAYTIITATANPLIVQSISRQNPLAQNTNASSMVWRVKFNRKVRGVDSSDFSLAVVSGALSGAISQAIPTGIDSTSYDVTAGSVSGNGTLRLDVKSTGTGITDSVGNALSDGFTSGETYLIDQTAPVVQSSNRQQPASDTTSASSVTFRVTFSKKVRGVDATDFSLTVESGSVSGVLGSGAVVAAGIDSMAFDVTVSNISGEGQLRLDVKAGGTGIADTLGNALNGGFASGQHYTIRQAVSPGITTLTPLGSVVVSQSTADKPQGKVWNYGGKWWSVLATSTGTKLFRMDGTTWTSVLTLNNATNAKADCRVVGNLVHVLLFRGASTSSYFLSLEYDSTAGNYKLWSQRTSTITLTFESGTETATLDVDGSGRLWIASDASTTVLVRYSNFPYSTFSSPITIASGISTDDISVIAAIPALGKIGVLWSNQTTKRFGFKTHSDGADPSSWSLDEVPAAQSALSIGSGMADDHLSMVAGSDGTLYCAVKAAYDKAGYPTVALLIRRPSGSWDSLYQVTSNAGTRPIVLLNEALAKLKVVYTSVDGGGDILYKETALSPISFGAPVTLISGGGSLLDNATSTHQSYRSEVAVLASNMSLSPIQVVGVLITDGVQGSLIASAGPAFNETGNTHPSSAEASVFPPGEKDQFAVFPNPFSQHASVLFTLQQSSDYALTLFDARGVQVARIDQGKAQAGTHKVDLNAPLLPGGLYFLQLRTHTYKKVLKLFINGE